MKETSLLGRPIPLIATMGAVLILDPRLWPGSKGQSPIGTTVLLQPDLKDATLVVGKNPRPAHSRNQAWGLSPVHQDG